MTAPRKPAAKTTVPAGAKKPADHQTAKDDVETTLMTFNWRGTDYEVDKNRIDDLEFMEKLENNMFANALLLMLGEKQYLKFKEQVKKAEGGRVPMQIAQDFITECAEFVGRGN